MPVGLHIVFDGIGNAKIMIVWCVDRCILHRDGKTLTEKDMNKMLINWLGDYNGIWFSF